MSVVYHEKYVEIIPENHYITDLEETAVYEGICGKNLDINNFKDITDEEAEEIMKRLENESEVEE